MESYLSLQNWGPVSEHKWLEFCSLGLWKQIPCEGILLYLVCQGKNMSKIMYIVYSACIAITTEIPVCT